MKKVLVLAYFFPPCHLTASQRTYAWAKYFHKKGLYPIILSNQWNREIDKVQIEKHKEYEVHYLPQKKSIRDKLNEGSPSFFKKSMSKAFTLFTLLFQSFFLGQNPFRHFYFYSDKLLEEDDEINSLIISANPFELFQVSYFLKKKHPKLKWIADYRDEWTTRDLYKQNRGKLAIVRYCEKIAEKKYTSNAEMITTVCSYFLDRIVALTKQKGQIISNGYNPEALSNIDKKSCVKTDKFSIVYSGTLYQNQPLEPFIQAFDTFMDEKTIEEKDDIELVFLGSKESISLSQRQILDNSKYDKSIVVLPRISFAEANKVLNAASLLLMFPYLGMEGIPSSKVYDNLIFKKRIVLFPSDENIIEEILADTDLGIIEKTSENLVKQLNKVFVLYKKGQNLKVENANIEKYSRQQATFALADIINQHL